MATYAVGDIQGCYKELCQLLEKIEFCPDRDRLILLGDLVNRGPDSLSVIRFAMNHRSCVDVVLGNHDLYLIAALEDPGLARSHDTFDDVLKAPDRKQIKKWLCRQPLIIYEPELNILAVHAGIFPLWSLDEALEYAREVEALLQGKCRREFLKNMFGNKPRKWSQSHSNWDRVRFFVNAFTRMRYINRKGKLDFVEMRTLGEQRKKLKPWFDYPGRVPVEPTIVFGHWSSLGVHIQPGILAMDSGCYWGRSLSAANLDSQPFKITQVKSERLQKKSA